MPTFRRLYWPTLLNQEQALTPLALEAEQAHYLLHVLRLQPGTSLELFDGKGQKAMATLQLIAAKPVRYGLQLLEIESIPKSSVQLHLICALPKGERADWLVEKASELGVVRLFWCQFQRSNAPATASSKIARWQKLAIAASQQCKRYDLPILEPSQKFTTLCQNILQQRPANDRLFYGSLDARPAQTACPTSANIPHNRYIVVGPEGGLSPEEEGLLESLGAEALCCSRYTLRIETAACALLALASII